MKSHWRVVLLDVFIYVLITIAGFISHDNLTIGSLGRMLATFVPFTLSWFLIAPWLGIYREDLNCSNSYLVRVAFAAAFAAPMGAFLRGLWLNAPILPIFILVMASISIVLMVAWRVVYRFIRCR